MVRLYIWYSQKVLKTAASGFASSICHYMALSNQLEPGILDLLRQLNQWALDRHLAILVFFTGATDRL